MKLFLAALLTLALIAPANAQFDVSPPGATSTPPPPAPAKPLSLPIPEEKTLPNGLRVVAVRTTAVPLITAELITKRGATSDPAGKLGAASLSADVMTAGTTTRDAVAISRAVDELGARLNASAGSDRATVVVSATTDKFSAALDIMADVIQHPTFPEKEVERARTQSLADFQQQYANFEGLARETSLRAAFGSDPYGNPVSGTPASVKSLTRSDLIAFHDAAFRPDNTVLVIGGDIDPAHAFELAARSFGGWPRPASPVQVSTPSNATTAPRFIVIDKEDAGAGAVAVTMRAPDRLSDAYFSSQIANSVIDGYSGRLNEAVRVKRGLAYGAASQAVSEQSAGWIQAYTLSVENPKLPEATDVVLATLREMSAAPVPQGELDTRRRSFLGERATRLQRERGVVGLLADYARYDQPLAGIATADASYNAVTPAQVQAFSAKYITRPTVVVIGKASVFLPELKAKYPNLEVIPFKQLDLGSASLTKGG